MKIPSLWRPWAGFTLPLLGLAIYLLPTLSLPLSRGEAMYAQVPGEMWASGTWTALTLNGAPYLEKPPLLYWLNLLAFKVFGVTDGAARLPTLALTLGEVWLTFALGCLLLPRRAAWLGGFVLLSSVGFFYLHLELFTDHLITLSLLAALLALLLWLKEPRLGWVCLFFLSLGAGYLSKGLIGLGFPLLIGMLYGWQIRQPRLRHLFLHPLGLALLALLIVPWLAATEMAQPGFLKHHLVTEHFIRFLGERQPGGVSTISLGLFWLFLGVWLLPWTLLLPSALYSYGKEVIRNPAGKVGSLLLIWAGVVLGVFSLSSTRIEYYSLPALPALALVLGWRVDRYLDADKDRVLPLALLALGVAGLGAGFLLSFLDRFLAGNRREFLGLLPLVEPLARWVAYTIPPLAFMGALLGRRRPRLALGTYMGLALALLFFTYQALAALSPVRSDKTFGDYVRSHSRPGDLVVMEYIEEFELGASLAFYAGRPILMVQRQGLPRFVFPVPPEKDYLIAPARLKELWQGPRRVFLLVDDAVPREPYLKEDQVVLRGGGKRLFLNRP
ncbi:MAG: glycosyltransferase family 39 protein [Thermodesulfobacteriota bacterium]